MNQCDVFNHHAAFFIDFTPRYKRASPHPRLPSLTPFLSYNVLLYVACIVTYL